MPIDLLSEPIRKYIRDKRWEELRPIQAAAIQKIMSADGNYILASRTASGKTEAAFLPILSRLNLKENGVQVLYISPLIALINDQFQRVEELCKYLDITITKWHGEASASAKKSLLSNPNGIILITPESIEAMFTNKPFNIKHLFSNLRYVVIDEIHSFIGSARGIHLKSLLSRIQITTGHSFNVIGLSATIGDYQEAKKFTGREDITKVLLDKTKKEIHVTFKYFHGESVELPLALMKDLYLETKDNKVFIFPNSRGTAEEVAVKLKKISERVGGHSNYFSHHSSVDKEVREYVEYFAKNSDRKSFCVACTSTLELGIDVGSVDEVVQIDSAHSIASLIQRVGRSGRKDGQASKLLLYATNRWSLLQAIACWELYQQEFIEPPEMPQKPYDILVHQMLSILKGGNGINLTQLLVQLTANFAFSNISPAEIEDITEHLLALQLTEKIGTELIVGIEGEKLVNSKDFYSLFISEPYLKVVHGGNKIGEIPLSPQIAVDENILLAAKVWKIKFVDINAKRIEVERAVDGRKPIFTGTYPFIHERIRMKMLEVLYSSQPISYLDMSSEKELQEMRQEFSAFKIANISTERPLIIKDRKVQLFSFTGTKINHALAFIFNINNIDITPDEKNSSFSIATPIDEFKNKWASLITDQEYIDEQLTSLVDDRPDLLDFSKWARYLPIKYQVDLLKQQYYDFATARQFLQTMKLIQGSD